MPAPKGGTIRKEQPAKQARSERMVKVSKNTLSESLTVGEPGTTLLNLNSLPEAAEIEAQAIPRLDEPDGTVVTTRDPFQSLRCFPTGSSIPQGQPLEPSPSRHPNKIVLRVSSTPRPEPITFLSLAQELRNQVYEYAIPRTKYRIQWIPRTDQRPTELTYTLPLDGYEGPHLTATAGRLRRDFDYPKRTFIDKDMPRYRLSPGPAALLLVSKAVNSDTTPMFYGQNTFSFAAMRPLGRFLDSLRPKTRQMIRSLELIHTTASNPQLRANQVWKYRHDRLWEKSCCRLGNELERLADLTIDLHIKDLPFKLGADANWMSSLRALMGLKHLKHLDVRLHQAETDDAVLEVEAYVVRKALMGDNFYEPVHDPGNKPPLEKPRPRMARPVPTRVTVGNRRVPASCINPSLGPGATVFWNPPPPRNPPPGEEPLAFVSAASKGNGVRQPPLVWVPPATLVGSAGTVGGESTAEGRGRKPLARIDQNIRAVRRGRKHG